MQQGREEAHDFFDNLPMPPFRQGKAQAIQDIAAAERNRIEQLRAAMLDENVLAYKSFESLIELSKNPANKVFIPTGAMDTLGALGAMGELFKAKQDAAK